MPAALGSIPANGQVALAADVPGAIVSSLPTSPANGQMCALRVDASGNANGPVIWHFRYDSTASLWMFVGGAALLTLSTGSGSTSSTVGVETLGSAEMPGIALPFSGTYDAELAGVANHSSSTGQCRMGLRFGDETGFPDPYAIASGTIPQALAMARRATLPAASVKRSVLPVYASGSGGPATFSFRTLRVTPVSLIP